MLMSKRPQSLTNSHSFGARLNTYISFSYITRNMAQVLVVRPRDGKLADDVPKASKESVIESRGRLRRILSIMKKGMKTPTHDLADAQIIAFMASNALFLFKAIVAASEVFSPRIECIDNKYVFGLCDLSCGTMVSFKTTEIAEVSEVYVYKPTAFATCLHALCMQPKKFGGIKARPEVLRGMRSKMEHALKEAYCNRCMGDADQHQVTHRCPHLAPIIICNSINPVYRRRSCPDRQCHGTWRWCQASS